MSIYMIEKSGFKVCESLLKEIRSTVQEIIYDEGGYDVLMGHY